MLTCQRCRFSGPSKPRENDFGAGKAILSKLLVVTIGCANWAGLVAVAPISFR
jgi:hypothetical protein